MNNSIAHAKYDNHVKESLLSGKPVEFSLKDFLPKKEQVKKKIKRKVNKEVEYNMTIEEVLSYAQNIYNIYHSEQKQAEEEGNKEKALENWKESQAYEILICKITGKEYVCNIPR